MPKPTDTEILESFVTLVKELTADQSVYLNYRSRAALQRSVELLHALRQSREDAPNDKSEVATK